MLKNVDAQEKNQCVMLHLVAGAQWIREGRKNGAPDLARVLAETEEYAAEVLSVSHDAAKCNHDRDDR